MSAGSLNGLFVSTFEKGQEKLMVSELVEIWKTNITKDTIYKSWGWGKLGILEGFYNKRGLYDNSPLV